MKYRFFDINNLTDEEYFRYYSLMSDEKKERLSAYRFDKDKRLSVAGEMLVKKLIADETGKDKKDIIIQTDENGKPFTQNADIHLSISHSNDLVIAAISSSEVGVDIEKIKPVSDSLINKVCTQKELEYVSDSSISKSEKEKRFFEIWTFKEAYFKFIGTGITDFKSICIFDSDLRHNIHSFFYNGYAVGIFTRLHTDTSIDLTQ